MRCSTFLLVLLIDLLVVVVVVVGVASGQYAGGEGYVMDRILTEREHEDLV